MDDRPKPAWVKKPVPELVNTLEGRDLIALGIFWGAVAAAGAVAFVLVHFIIKFW